MISIIVPVYNGEKCIEQCIKSILNQNYIDFELLIVDDGSTDGTGAICDKYEKYDNRIKVFHIKNGGVSHARNYGLAKAKGNYIQFIDSDDYIAKDYSKAMIEKIREFNADLVITNYCVVSDLKKEITNYEINEGIYSPKQIVEKLFQTNTLLNSPVNKLYKRNLIKKTFDETISLGEDLLFNMNYLEQADKIYFVTQSLYFYIRNDASLTNTYKQQSFYDLNYLLELSSQYVGEDAAIVNYTSNVHDCLCLLVKNTNISYSLKHKYFNENLELIKNNIIKISSVAYNNLPKTHRILVRLIQLRLSYVCFLLYFIKLYILSGGRRRN